LLQIHISTKRDNFLKTETTKWDTDQKWTTRWFL